MKYPKVKRMVPASKPNKYGYLWAWTWVAEPETAFSRNSWTESLSSLPVVNLGKGIWI